MAQNAWIQFNTSLRRVALMRGVNFKDDMNSYKNDDTKPELTFGQWLQKEWKYYPKISYPKNNDTDYDELIILLNY